MTRMEQERAVAFVIERLEAVPEGRTNSVLILALSRGAITHQLSEGETVPQPGETWTDQSGQVWRVQTAFTLKDSKVNCERPAAWLVRVRAGAPSKEMTA